MSKENEGLTLNDVMNAITGMTGQMSEMGKDAKNFLSPDETAKIQRPLTGGMTLVISDAGSYLDEKTLKKVDFDEFIKVKLGGYGMKFTATQLAALVFQVSRDQEVKKELQTRLDEEQKLAKELKF